MKAGPKRPRPLLLCCALALLCQPACGGRLVGSSLRAAESRARGQVAQALRWLLRTRAKVSRLERSLESSQASLVAWASNDTFGKLAAQLDVESSALKQLHEGNASGANASLVASKNASLASNSSGRNRSLALAVATNPDVVAASKNESQEVQDALNATMTSLEDLEKSMGTARTRLSGAERKTVNASLDMPSSRKELIRLQNVTAENKDMLQNLSTKAMELNTSLAADDTALERMMAKANLILGNASDLENASGAQLAVVAEVNNLTTLVKNAVSEGPDSVADLKRRMDDLEANTTVFAEKLGGKVHEYMVRRLRRGTKEVRGALNRMMDQIPPMVDVSGMADFPTEPPIGADLGLAD